MGTVRSVKRVGVILGLGGRGSVDVCDTNRLPGQFTGRGGQVGGKVHQNRECGVNVGAGHCGIGRGRGMAGAWTWTWARHALEEPSPLVK
jgi:hypothetical protein